jgi:trypsin
VLVHIVVKWRRAVTASSGDGVEREAEGMRIVRRATLAVAMLSAVLLTPVALAGSPSATPAPGGPGGGAPAEPFVVGGRAATVSEYPWMVALTTPASESAYCGGALVAPDRVLTAAHCISGYRLGGVRVIAGRTDLRSDEGEVRMVQRAWIPPGYRAPTEGDDIAVLVLDRALSYRTLPLETDHGAYPPGRPAIVLGWGYTAENGPSSPMLRSAEVPLVEDGDCADIYRDFDADSMVCAGDPSSGMDACYGDSGGPLVAGDRLIGITSWGSGCAREGAPGVYSRVAAYATVINEQLDDGRSVTRRSSATP